MFSGTHSIISLIQPSVRVKELERQIDQLILLPAVLLQVAITRETHSKNSRHVVLHVCVVCVVYMCRRGG